MCGSSTPMSMFSSQVRHVPLANEWNFRKTDGFQQFPCNAPTRPNTIMPFSLLHPNNAIEVQLR